jgi:hypothetical protein
MPFADEAAAHWFGWPQAFVAAFAIFLGSALMMAVILFMAAITLGPEAVIRIILAAAGRGEK